MGVVCLPGKDPMVIVVDTLTFASLDLDEDPETLRKNPQGSLQM
jgi:hypothetical protein